MKFQKYQFSRQKDIDTTVASDIQNYKLYLQNENQRVVPNLFHSIKNYFIFRNHLELVDLAKKVASDCQFRPDYSQSTIPWIDFKNKLSSLQDTISTRDHALLNLLWSEMKYKEISALSPEDIDFKKAVITSRLTDRTNLATNEAWEALFTHIFKNDGEKKKDLHFHRTRHVYTDIAREAFKNLGWTPDKIRQSCLKDLYEAGKHVRFKIADSTFEQVNEKKEEMNGMLPNKAPRQSLYNQVLTALQQFKETNQVRLLS